METQRRKYIVLLSILLHILILLLWESAIKLGILGLEFPQESTLNSQPILFDLQQPEGPRQVIETPEHARVEEQKNKARFLSDKNAIAKNQEAAPDLKIGEPFARGVIDSHELPFPGGTRQEQPAPNPPRPTGEEQPSPQDTDFKRLADYLDVSKIFPFSKQESDSQKEAEKQGLPRVDPGALHKNLDSKSLETGGLSFNTYDWNFAPYMLGLKHKIQRNIFPPMAFTHLGIIDGETLLRFRIDRDGRMTKLEILDYRGHKTLMETSYNAVKVSAPFDALPLDFPEPYLEVSGKFIYFVQRETSK